MKTKLPQSKISQACDLVHQMDMTGVFLRSQLSLEMRDNLQKLLRQVEAEHSALVAVAEAAKILSDGIALCAGRWPQDERFLNEALANLAAVRE